MEERLQKFVRLVDAGSFTKAAQKMHVSQPALTVAIAKLEKELGAQLILRESRPLELTDAGRVAYDAGVTQALAIDNLRTNLADLAGKRPNVRIGLTDSVAAMLAAYPMPLTNLERAADLSLIVNNSHFLRTAVEERSLDLAITITNEKRAKSAHIADELMVMVVSPLKLAAKEAQAIAGKMTDYISYDKHSTTHQVIENELAELGITLRTKLQSSSPEIIAHMVVSGGGVAVLPYFMVRSQLITGSLVVVQKNGKPVTLVRRLGLVEITGKHQAECAQVFIKEITEVLKAAYTEATEAVGKLKRKR